MKAFATKLNEYWNEKMNSGNPTASQHIGTISLYDVICTHNAVMRNTWWGSHVYETSNDLLIKQHSVIEFLAAEGCSAANIHARMKTVYGEMCISDCAVHK
ncbi:transposase [Plakobranchus ocellatus]|uniref:Transposase n=1 Tax=Plakobranchus ocellatus TaxID=259542 RepID=A0AAV4BCF6_9GAST|nr:transposase [Plakobranchus ocellatus]